MLEVIRMVMTSFDAKGLVGNEFLQEDCKESVATEGEGAGGGEGSQAGAAREVVPVASEDDGRVPPMEVPFVPIPLEDYEAKEDAVPLAVRMRRHTVLSDKDLGGSNRGEEVSSRRAHAVEATAGSAHQ